HQGRRYFRSLHNGRIQRGLIIPTPQPPTRREGGDGEYSSPKGEEWRIIHALRRERNGEYMLSGERFTLL
ncbi:MAG: hypothetical protein J6U36_08040, partial [Oscillospiraceae bacterium]|nr:hypothetical protein [Oscillospiraceae bacterium]